MFEITHPARSTTPHLSPAHSWRTIEKRCSIVDFRVFLYRASFDAANQCWCIWNEPTWSCLARFMLGVALCRILKLDQSSPSGSESIGVGAGTRRRSGRGWDPDGWERGWRKASCLQHVESRPWHHWRKLDENDLHAADGCEEEARNMDHFRSI